MAEAADTYIPPAQRRWEQRPDKGVATGVLAGIGYKLNVDPMLLRIVFTGLVVLTGGLLLVGYGLAIAFMPVAETQTNTNQPSIGARFAGLIGNSKLLIGVALIAVAVLLVFRELGIWLSDALVWPIVLAAVGIALLLRITWEPGGTKAAGDATGSKRTRVRDLYRGGFGIALVVGAALLFLLANNALGPVRDVALAVIVGTIAIALIALPFLFRWGRTLTEERDSRIRSEERAEVAAHLHDSVLQTLALIQKRSTEPAQVVNLARRQERELRAWLYAGNDAHDHRDPESLMATLQATAENVEDTHETVIEIVHVGDRPLDTRLDALVAGTREALTNAAKFAGGHGPISLYAEADPEGVAVYIRDRGPGFKIDDIPEDRRGLRDSIIGRMERHGGSATVISPMADGKGTEIRLEMKCKTEAGNDTENDNDN